MSADEGVTAGVTFTPRRSHRCNKLEMSLKEEDLRKSLNSQHTPSRLSRFLNPDMLHCPLDSPPKGASSEEKNYSKKRNKKSKKQKGRANLKRKDAKQFKRQDSGSGSNQETSEILSENGESGVGASSKELNLTASNVDTKEQSVEAATEEVKDDDLSVEIKAENVESGLESSKMKEAASSMQSPDLSSNRTDDVISLITPDLNGESDQINSKDSSQERSKEETKDGTYELSEPSIPASELKHEAAKVECRKEIVASAALRCGPRFSSTPARKSVQSRKGTPFKPIKEGSVKKTVIANIASPNRLKAVDAMIVTPITGKLFTKTPLKSALRRSRRSYSCDTPTVLNTTTKRAVAFNSPLNTTIHIDEVDLLMKGKKQNAEESGSAHVTMRRKRSLSVAETETEIDFVKSFLPSREDAPSTKKSSRAPTPSSRVKVPNFAAIHRQQFAKMESILDHVARKNERLKVLSGSKPQKDLNASVTKAKEASVNVSSSKDIFKKDVKRLNGAPKPINRQPRARQRIELANIKVNKKPTIAAVKSVLQENKNIVNKSLQTTVTKGAKKPIKATKTSEKSGENLIDRQKEHMSMYKNNSCVNETILKEERKDYIAGVRSNRRFMLQMQHRDRLYK